MDPTADVKLDFENKDAENNRIKHWVRDFVDALKDPGDIELVLDVNNDEKLEGKHCGKTLDDIAVFVSIVNDDCIDNL